MAHDRDRPRHPGYANFELEVGRGKGRVYPVEIRSPAGDLQVTMRFLTPKALKTHLLQVENALLRSSGAHRLVLGPEQQAVQAFGRDLFDAVLPEEARGLYYQSLREAELQGQGLRFKLRIASPELAALPWEFLFDARNHQYVGLSADTPIVRDLGLPQPIEPLRVDPPIRILGMIASPRGTAPLDVTREQLRMDEALKPLQEQGTVTLDWLSGQTWRELQQALRRGTYHVFHFMGHGGFDPRKDEGLVLLADERGAPHRLPATELAMLLHDAKALRLAVLNSCDTALGGGTDLFASTASILVRQGEIPAVLAMQFAISDPAAIEFSRTFYEAIAEGLPVDAAVAEARKAVRLAIPDTLEWATPVLHQRSPDGILFDLQRPVEAPDPRSPVSPPLAGADLAAEPGVRSNKVSELATQPYTSAGGLPGAEVVGGSGRASLRELWEGLSGAAKTLTGVLTAAAGLLAALVAAGLLPLDREPPPAVIGSGSSSLSAVLSDIAIADRALALGDFCERRDLACEGYDDVARRRPGNVVRFTIETEGYKGQKLPISWSMYDATQQRIVTEPALRYQDGWPAGFYVPASDEDRNDGELWVPLPPTPGTYFVRVEIQSPEREILNTKDTESFDVR